MSKRPFERKDRFYKLAKKQGYVARSAYKIMELDKRFGIFKTGNQVIDLGAAPGGWFQVGQERLKKGILIGIDLLPLQTALTENSYFLQGDFTKTENREWLKDKIKKGVDWVISDMSPNISGIKFRDEFLSYELVNQALDFSLTVLKPGGSFLCKIFPGMETQEFRDKLKAHFQKTVTVIPEATRKSSTEIYMVGVRSKAPGRGL